MIHSVKKYNLSYLLVFLMLVMVSCQKGDMVSPQFDDVEVSSDDINSPSFREGDDDTNGDGTHGTDGSGDDDGGSDDGGVTIIGGDDNEDDDGGGKTSTDK